MRYMIPHTQGTPVYLSMVATFIERFNQEQHTLGELRNRWRTIHRGNISIKMKLSTDHEGFTVVDSLIYFRKKRRDGECIVPKFCTKYIGVYPQSTPDWFAVFHSRAGKARFAYTNESDVILLTGRSA